MKEYKSMTVTELDRMYWESFGKMRNAKDQRTYREYCQIGGEIIKELESRGIITPSDIAEAIKKESVTA